jgi:hypothetical protein
MVERTKTANLIISYLFRQRGISEWSFLTKRESEAPPPHIEGKCSTFVDRRYSEEEPQEAEAPHDEGDDEAKDVEYLASVGCEWEALVRWKYLDSILSEQEYAVMS